MTVVADKLNAKLPVSVMMNLPLFGMALSGEKLRVSVTEDVARITLFNFICGAVFDAESTMAGNTPDALSQTTVADTTAARTLTRDAWAVDGFVTVLGSLKDISEPAENVPPVKVTIRSPLATPSVALAPDAGDINATVDADKVGALPESVITSL